jgi:hypothetical protein
MAVSLEATSFAPHGVPGADKCQACFNVTTGDIEDAPALDPLAKFEILEKDGAVYIKGDESTIKASRRKLNLKCTAKSQDKVVIVGGCVYSSCEHGRYRRY